MSLQSELVKSNINPDIISSYSKIEIKEDTDFEINTNYSQVLNNPSENIPEQIHNNDIKIINETSFSVNSDQIRPITHKYNYSKLGNTYTFFADEKGNPLFIIGPHWPLAAGVIISFSIIFFGTIIYLRKLLSNSNIFLGYLSYLFFLISYITTAIVNPGYPKHDENTLCNKNKDKTGYCSVCKIWISLEKKTKHCKFCNICIEGMDHHCPWVGKCVARKNIIPFFLFLISVFGFMCYCIITILSCKNELNKGIKK